MLVHISLANGTARIYNVGRGVGYWTVVRAEEPENHEYVCGFLRRAVVVIVGREVAVGFSIRILSVVILRVREGLLEVLLDLGHMQLKPTMRLNGEKDPVRAGADPIGWRGIRSDGVGSEGSFHSTQNYA